MMIRRIQFTALIVTTVLASRSAVTAATYEQEVMSDKPFVYYRFEEESGSMATDTSGNEHHGEYVDGVALNRPSATDALGRAAEFDGETGYVQVPILEFESDTATIETWINLEFLSVGCCTSIFSPDGWQTGWLHYNLKGDNNIEFALNGGGPNNHNSIPDAVPFEEWTHIASVYDADEAIVSTYVNGEQVDVFPEDFQSPQTLLVIVEAQIAAWQNTRFLGGLLDEFAIYDSALSEERIAAHFAAAFAPSVRGDYNGNGVLDEADLDLQAQAIKDQDLAFDENADGFVDAVDRRIWVNELKNTWVGDADLDGKFDSSDFVTVFTEGKYEVPGVTATWGEGDWDGDMDFDTSDFVVAFVDGGYEMGERPGGPNPVVAAVPEPSSIVLLLTGTFAFLCGRRRLALDIHE